MEALEAKPLSGERVYNEATRYLPLINQILLTCKVQPEVARLEARRDVIFDGVRRGFARAYDALVEDPAERGRGDIVAREYFPDEILEYNPMLIDSKTESAFQIHLKEKGENPEQWKASASYVMNVER